MYYLPWTVSLKTLALIVIAIFVIKMVVLLVKPKAWMDLAEKIYMNTIVTVIVSVILGYLVLGSLVEAGITYVQIFAVISFVILLFALSIAIYAKEMIALGRNLINSGSLWKKAWFPVLVWVVLCVLALNEMYSFF